MVRFLSLLLMFSVGTAQAAYLPAASSFSFGGVTVVGKRIITLSAQMSGNGGWSTFKNSNAQGITGATPASGYTPSGSNIFCVIGVRIENIGMSVWADYQLGYGTVDMGWNQASSSGTVNYLGGAGPGFSSVTFGSPSIPATTSLPAPVIEQSWPGHSFPNGSYPFVYWKTNLNQATYYHHAFMFGYEATVCD